MTEYNPFHKWERLPVLGKKTSFYYVWFILRVKTISRLYVEGQGYLVYIEGPKGRVWYVRLVYLHE